MPKYFDLAQVLALRAYGVKKDAVYKVTGV